MRQRLQEWEKRLDRILAQIDERLEERYHGQFRLHPARPEHGTTANRAYDGLFHVKANFTLGIGTGSGRGYMLDVRVSTLERISPETRAEILDFTLTELNRLLPEEFGAGLEAVPEANGVKIVGDLSL
jgi:hypothetical protein